MGLPAGSSTRICEPPGPLTMSLRNVDAGCAQPLHLRFEVVDEKMDAVPATGSGCLPSGMGSAAELDRPPRSSRRLPRCTSANAGALVRRDLEAEMRRVEGDRRLDVVDHVPDVNRADGHDGHVTEQAPGAVSRPR